MHSYKIKNLPKYSNYTILKKYIKEGLNQEVKIIYRQGADYANIRSSTELTVTEIPIRKNKCKIVKCEEKENEARTEVDITDIRDRVTSLWNINYEEQVRIKKDELQSFYKMNINFYETNNFFRNNCQFTFGFCDEVPWLGFKGNGKNNKVYNIEQCVNVSNTMKARIHEINGLIKDKHGLIYDTSTKTGYLRGFMIRETEKEQIALLQIHGENKNHELDYSEILEPFVLDIISQLKFENLYLQFYNKDFAGFVPSKIFKVKGKDCMIQEIGLFKFKISFFSFFQVNSQIAAKICEKIIEKKPKNNVLYDLCCGSGFFGIILSKNFEKIYGIESNESSVKDANYNIEINKLKNYDITLGDVNLFELSKGSALLDPPRSGVSKKFISKLRKSEINEIFFISCDYKQSYQNIIDLCKETSNQYPNEPFVIQSIEAYDMFPNTEKSEVFIHLTR